MSDKSETENFFLDCVDEMKKEVTKKRMSGLPKISTSKILPYQDSKLNVDLDDDNNRPID